MQQLDLLERERPEGLSYYPEFISVEEEVNLLRFFQTLKWEEVILHGVPARRKVCHFGLRYTFSSQKLLATPSLPTDFDYLMVRVSQALGVTKEEIGEILVTYYPVGAPIGWHRDAPQFEALLGISLLSECEMRFRKHAALGKTSFSQTLHRRSAYVISGVARFEWQHHIPPVKAERYSMTFRTLRK